MTINQSVNLMSIFSLTNEIRFFFVHVMNIFIFYYSICDSDELVKIDSFNQIIHLEKVFIEKKTMNHRKFDRCCANTPQNISYSYELLTDWWNRNMSWNNVWSLRWVGDMMKNCYWKTTFFSIISTTLTNNLYIDSLLQCRFWAVLYIPKSIFPHYQCDTISIIKSYLTRLCNELDVYTSFNNWQMVRQVAASIVALRKRHSFDVSFLCARGEHFRVGFHLKSLVNHTHNNCVWNV